MTQRYAEKARLDLIDFSIDYTDEMAQSDPTDIITASVWTKEGNIVIEDGTLFTGTTSTVWVSGGGQVGEISRLHNVVTTNGGREFHYTLIVKMVTKQPQPPSEDVVIPV